MVGMLLAGLESRSCLRCMQPYCYNLRFLVCDEYVQIHHLVRLLFLPLHRAHPRPHPHRVGLSLVMTLVVPLSLLPAAIIALVGILLAGMECRSCLRCMQLIATTFAFWYVMNMCRSHHLVRLLFLPLHRAHPRPHPHRVSLSLVAPPDVVLSLLLAVIEAYGWHAACWHGMSVMLEMHATILLQPSLFGM